MSEAPIENPFDADFSRLRERFRAAAAGAGAELFAYPHPQQGPAGEALALDVAALGAQDAAHLLVVLSGTHGVEGPFGSVCQTAWLGGRQAAALPADVGVLLIHLLNPWGTAWSRRVNEDNIDLNRNFVDWAAGAPRNEAYREVHEALAGGTAYDGAEREAADARLSEMRQRLGAGGFASVVEAGQYEFADGLYFGGTGPTWSSRTLTEILARFAGKAKDVVVFDLHTGAGPYGYPALLSVAEAEHPGLAWGRSIFGPAMTPVLTGRNATTTTGIAATATGYVSDAVVKALPQARVLPLVVECGTLDGPTVFETVRADNWLHCQGDVASPRGRAIKASLRAAFVPADPHWKDACVGATLRHFERALQALGALARDAAPAPAPAPAPAAATAEQAIRPAVRVIDLHKRFGRLDVLKGVSVTARPGDIVSMIGSSGSGKSTFLRCINLLEIADRGRIILDGEEVRMKALPEGRSRPADRRQVERLRTRAGMVFQTFNLWPHLTVIENIVEAPVHVLRQPRKEAVEHAHALLEKVGLAEKHAHYPDALSGGQQQRVAIARTLAMRPKLILLDEPTSALDPELVGEVLRVIRRLADEGNTMILVTHEMQFAREVSDKILFLHQGKVEEEGPPSELFARPRSERLRQFLARMP